jgi:transcription elongation factor Elf1
MKIKKYTRQLRNDFSAEMECEHCNHVAMNKTGYHDAFYHSRVIPAMRCASCGKNRAGEMTHTDQDVTPVAL